MNRKKTPVEDFPPPLARKNPLKSSTSANYKDAPYLSQSLRPNRRIKSRSLEEKDIDFKAIVDEVKRKEQANLAASPRPLPRPPNSMVRSPSNPTETPHKEPPNKALPKTPIKVGRSNYVLSIPQKSPSATGTGIPTLVVIAASSEQTTEQPLTQV